MESRNVAYKEKQDCCGCGGCFNICPKEAVSMQYDDEGFLYPVVDASKCINCGLCLKTCPTEDSNQQKEISIISASCGRYKDRDKVKKVSSGGICDAIATKFIKQGGVVYGATYSEDYKSVIVSRVADINELPKIRGSKYVQTIKEGIYKQIKADIRSGIKVLFIGVPCDVASVKAYVGNSDLLYTVEIICSGVTTPLAHRQFIEDIENRTGKKVTGFNYRKKQHGWHWPYVEAISGGKVIYNRTWSNTALGYAFGVLVRPSCYNCKFKGEYTQSDLTAGDFWGLKKTDKRYYYNGVSAILIHTPKGKSLMEEIQDFKLEDATYEEIRQGNPRLYASTKEKGIRKKFVSIFKEKGLIKAYQECLTPIDRVKMVVMQVYSILNLR